MAEEQIVDDKVEEITEDPIVNPSYPPLPKNIYPLTIYKEKFRDDKLPERFSSTAKQNHTTATEFTPKVAYLCTEIMVVVKTARSNEARRRKMRFELNKLKKISHFFLMGRASQDDGLDELLQNETAQYEDIVFGEFVDTYYNLTIKSLSALEWIKVSCPNTKLTVLCDDDVHFVDQKSLIKLAGWF